MVPRLDCLQVGGRTSGVDTVASHVDLCSYKVVINFSQLICSIALERQLFVISVSSEC